MSRRTKYSDEEKFRIVSMVLDNKLGYKEVAERTSVPEGTISTFVNKYRNQYGSESPVSLGLVKVDQLMEVQEETKWYTSKEMCEMCNVDERTLKNFNKNMIGETDCPDHILIKGGYHNNQNLYSEEALKQFQLWLMRNQSNQGRASEVVKQNTEEQVKLGALTSCIQLNGDMEAAQQFCDLLMANTKAVAECKALEAQNRLALEENKKLEEENNRLEEENNRLEEENAEKDVIINKQMVNTEFFKNDKEALSYEQAARLLGISVKTLISTLQDRHILLSHGEPQQKYIDEKWFIWSLDTEQTDYGYLNHEWSYITPVGMTHLEKLFPKL